jgi:hypothetical protein
MLCRIGLSLDDEHNISVLLAFLFLSFRFYLQNKKNRINQTVVQKYLKYASLLAGKKRSKIKFYLHLAWQIIKRSRTKQIYLNLDTRNVIANAMLFPLFAGINDKPRIDLNINFKGNFSFSFMIRNNLLNILAIFFKIYFRQTLKSKKWNLTLKTR